MCLLFLPGICLHNSLLWVCCWGLVHTLSWHLSNILSIVPIWFLHSLSSSSLCLLSSVEVLIAYVKLYTTFQLVLWKFMKLNDFIWFNSLKQKMSVQEVSLLINQEQEIFYLIYNLIISSIYLKKVQCFYKRKCLQLSILTYIL